VLLHLDGMSETLPAPGTPVGSGTREVGRVGTVVRHHELGVIALALVKQSVTVGTPLKVGEAVAALDPDDAPQDVDADVAAARDRVRAVRSATIHG
jgi:folate-binding Fe-S cluster repair protein YgfZ